jgi:hypothetical protein
MKFKQSLAVAFTFWQRPWFSSRRTREARQFGDKKENDDGGGAC